jgi:O-antigen/teichoic acid export membrane protein
MQMQAKRQKNSSHQTRLISEPMIRIYTVMHTPDTHPSFFPEETLQTKLVRNGFWLYFFQALLAPAGYLVKMMISREMSPEDIGLFYSMIGLVGIASAYSDLGLTEALQYYLPRYLIDRQYAQTKTIVVFTLLVQMITGALVA